MKIYLTYEIWDHERASAFEVFSSREKAEAYIRRRTRELEGIPNFDRIDCEDIEVDRSCLFS